MTLIAVAFLAGFFVGVLATITSILYAVDWDFGGS